MRKSHQEQGLFKPMLASTVPLDRMADLPYPIAATPKIDGIRAIAMCRSPASTTTKCSDIVIVSRTLKPIPNKFIQRELASALSSAMVQCGLIVVDGELVYGDTFQETTSFVMSASPTTTSMPNHQSKVVRFCMFDCLGSLPRSSVADTDMPYMDRVAKIARCSEIANVKLANIQLKIVPVLPTIIKNEAGLLMFERDACLSKGFEGVMMRTLDGRYKYGRSTFKEGLLMKLKRFTDAEARIVGFVELVHKATIDSIGKTSTHGGSSSSSSGLLGAFVVVPIVTANTDSRDGRDSRGNDEDAMLQTEFNVGTGFTHMQRKEFWSKRKSLLGRIVKFKYLVTGTKNAPRHPVFLGFRNEDDM